MKKNSQIKPSYILGINILNSITALVLIVDCAILLHKKLAPKFNNESTWVVGCKVSDKDVIIYESAEGLDNIKTESFVDKKGCTVKRGGNCVAVKCPPPKQ